MVYRMNTARVAPLRVEVAFAELAQQALTQAIGRPMTRVQLSAVIDELERRIQSQYGDDWVVRDGVSGPTQPSALKRVDVIWPYKEGDEAMVALQWQPLSQSAPRDVHRLVPQLATRFDCVATW